MVVGLVKLGQSLILVYLVVEDAVLLRKECNHGNFVLILALVLDMVLNLLQIGCSTLHKSDVLFNRVLILKARFIRRL